ncbi:MAG: bifunctional phosphoribosylaminoimidazolecarboxamide formyltransferase/IMP cyclohydrolase [Candidatus Omnitrophica bacterium]|nr:bifunctional phosphoribosylaminoimidazolecarboxamide formyltransferase/IMP cyclohydrolase [Candidatus Omnitrophota bacterium]
MIKVERALISVSDKTGLIEFARALNERNVEILSTGGTARLLRGAQIPVKEVSDYTGFPEILDGRVKTLHPSIHGGLLAVRDKPEHMAQLRQHNIGTIDLVVVNLYPFEKTTQKKNVSMEEAIENIDIGGPSMIRSAAKNFKSVAVVCNPKRYKEILGELEINSGLLPDSVLRNLAVEAFQHTSRYDSVIFDFLNNRLKSGDFFGLPKELTLRYTKVQDLRYGENPHQNGAFYREYPQERGLAKIKQLHGKELSFNNILDLNAAVDVIKDFIDPAVVIIKHNNPTGVAEDATLAKAYKQAHSCDPISAFGGIIGLNTKVDEDTAQLIMKSGFMECVIAPGYDRKALQILKTKKNLRLVQISLKDLGKTDYDIKQVDGGLLLQDKDKAVVTFDDLKIVSKKKPTKSQLESLLFGWKVVRHIQSNAIILVKGKRTVGMGGGQTSRVESVALAIKKAGKDAQGALLVSDAFIPKTDNIVLAAKAGIKAIIQTGGSIADKDVIVAADKARIPMVMTGVRHFRH